MIAFLQENAVSIFGMVVLTITALIFFHFHAKKDVQTLDNKRVVKGMNPMTEDEKQLSLQSFRTSSREAAILIFVAYVASLVMDFIF